MRTCPLCGSAATGTKEAKFLCKRCHVLLDNHMMGMILGRFQPFHNGHLELVRSAAHEVDRLVIVIGSSLKHGTAENPFTAEERRDMIEAVLKEESIPDYTIVAVSDILLDEEYVNHVRQFTPPFNIVYAGTNALTAKLFGEAGFDIRTCDRFGNIEGSVIRKKMLTNNDWKKDVPKKVAEYIEKIDGVNRIKKLFVQG